MREKLSQRNDDRGQVGIGTLIVFIAMVLVAAIAAGVLINTAGFLQSSAEETGQQSSDQVTNRLQVVSSVGEDINGDTVDTVRITVKQAPGANNIDLSTTTLQFVHSSGSTDLTYPDTGGYQDASPGNANDFSVTDVQDEDNSISGDDNVVLNDPSDRAQIILDTSSITSSGFGERSATTGRLPRRTGSSGTSTRTGGTGPERTRSNRVTTRTRRGE